MEYWAEIKVFAKSCILVNMIYLIATLGVELFLVPALIVFVN